MAQKINLAVLNKKKEELTQTEMAKNLGGIICGCSPIEVTLNYNLNLIDQPPCQCGSIWMVFGMGY
jgi:hypothetical protein